MESESTALPLIERMNDHFPLGLWRNMVTVGLPKKWPLTGSHTGLHTQAHPSTRRHTQHAIASNANLDNAVRSLALCDYSRIRRLVPIQSSGLSNTQVDKQSARATSFLAVLPKFEIAWIERMHQRHVLDVLRFIGPYPPHCILNNRFCHALQQFRGITWSYSCTAHDMLAN